MQVSIEGKNGSKVLRIEIPLQRPTPSASGKTMVIATTHGNVQTGAVIDGKPVIVGMNAYIRAK
jgi:hypothetical protein